VPNHILIVDDNPANLKLARVLLVSEGYQVSTAMNAAEALTAIAARPPALILMDVQLPGMDGLALTKQLKANPSTRHIVVIALTAYAMIGDDAKAIDAGCDGYITKPINTRTLPAAIAGWLRPSRELHHG